MHRDLRASVIPVLALMPDITAIRALTPLVYHPISIHIKLEIPLHTARELRLAWHR